MKECDDVITDVWNRIIIVKTIAIVDPRMSEGFNGTPNSFALRIEKSLRKIYRWFSLKDFILLSISHLQ